MSPRSTRSCQSKCRKQRSSAGRHTENIADDLNHGKIQVFGRGFAAVERYCFPVFLPALCLRYVTHLCLQNLGLSMATCFCQNARPRRALRTLERRIPELVGRVSSGLPTPNFGDLDQYEFLGVALATRRCTHTQTYLARCEIVLPLILSPFSREGGSALRRV